MYTLLCMSVGAKLIYIYDPKLCVLITVKTHEKIVFSEIYLTRLVLNVFQWWLYLCLSLPLDLLDGLFFSHKSAMVLTTLFTFPKSLSLTHSLTINFQLPLPLTLPLSLAFQLPPLLSSGYTPCLSTLFSSSFAKPRKIKIRYFPDTLTKLLSVSSPCCISIEGNDVGFYFRRLVTIVSSKPWYSVDVVWNGLEFSVSDSFYFM